MEEERNRIYTVVALVALATLLLSCIAGALAGGVVGAVVGRRQAQVAMEGMLEGRLPSLPGLPERKPGPWQEERSLPDEEPLPHELIPEGEQTTIIVEVIPDTPADKAGLRTGDLISAIDTIPIDSRHPLSDVIRQYEPGDRITIHFWRAGEEDSVLVKLTEHPDHDGRAYLGVYFDVVE